MCNRSCPRKLRGNTKRDKKFDVPLCAMMKGNDGEGRSVALMGSERHGCGAENGYAELVVRLNQMAGRCWCRLRKAVGRSRIRRITYVKRYKGKKRRNKEVFAINRLEEELKNKTWRRR